MASKNSSSKNNMSLLLPMVLNAVKLSHELPTAKTPAFVYYNDFPQYKTILSAHSKSIISNVQKVIDALDAKGNVLNVPEEKSLSEKFASLVDVNDRLLERLLTAMDDVETPNRKKLHTGLLDNDLVIASQSRSSRSLHWLKGRSSLTDKSESKPGTNQSDDQSNSAINKNKSSDSVISLFGSRDVVRPQTTFSRAVDNSDSPFRPQIEQKFNALQPSSVEWREKMQNCDGDEYPHPYIEELTTLEKRPVAPPKEQTAPRPLDETPLHMITDKDQLDQVIKELSQASEIAVDLEHHSYRTYFGITCLIQLSTRTADYILDALTLRDHLHQLNRVFTNPNILKVFHGSTSDLNWLQRDFSVYVVNLFDTGEAAKALKFPRASLSYLLHTYADVNSNKKYQLADWRIRPLPSQLIDYARSDTHYLLFISDVMQQQLHDRNLLQFVMDQCRKMCLKVYTKPRFMPYGYVSLFLKGDPTSLGIRQLQALHHLYALRDSIARREDESLHYVLPNHMLKVVAETLPREASGVFACCNPVPPLVRKYVHDISKVVADARQASNLELESFRNFVCKNFDQTTEMSSSELSNVETGRNNRNEVDDFIACMSCPHDMRRRLPPDDTDESSPAKSKYPRLDVVSVDYLKPKQSPLILSLSSLNRKRETEGVEFNNSLSKSQYTRDGSIMLLRRLLDVLKQGMVSESASFSAMNTPPPETTSMISGANKFSKGQKYISQLVEHETAKNLTVFDAVIPFSEEVDKA